MKITASYALLIGTVAALLLMLTPGVAGAQSTLNPPTNLTATPGAGVVYLEWTPPPDAELHFVAWLPVGANPADAQIRPADAAGETAITGLLMVSQFTYYSPKELDLKGRVPFLTLVAAVLVFAIVLTDPPRVLLACFTVYALSGPAMYLWRKYRGVEEAAP